MNKVLKYIFLGLALLLGAYATLRTWDFYLWKVPILTSKTLWILALVIAGLLWTAFKSSKETKFKLFLVAASFILLEVLLQIMALAGILPGVNTKYKCPYARVYWSAEGRGNSIRNSAGWYYPEFDLHASNRIAVIGDSFVEAAEVHRTRNHAALLNGLIRQRSPQSAVMAFGMHGCCPAQHLETLEYAHRHFQPTEVLLYLYLGNDVSESLPELNYTPPDNYVYYNVDEQNRLVLNPASGPALQRFRDSLEYSHKPFGYWATTLVSSHWMTLQALESVGDKLKQRKTAAQIQARLAQAGRTDAVSHEMGVMGLNPAPFAVNRSPEVVKAMKILERELERCQEICNGYGMRFRLVTIPGFPARFYESQHGKNWSSKLGDYDYLLPERELTAWAKTRNIDLFALGNFLQTQNLPVEEIRAMYHGQGTGHFTEKGHQICSEAVFQAFYQNQPR